MQGVALSFVLEGLNPPVPPTILPHLATKHTDGGVPFVGAAGASSPAVRSLLFVAVEEIILLLFGDALTPQGRLVAPTLGGGGYLHGRRRPYYPRQEADFRGLPPFWSFGLGGAMLPHKSGIPSHFPFLLFGRRQVKSGGCKSSLPTAEANHLAGHMIPLLVHLSPFAYLSLLSLLNC